MLVFKSSYSVCSHLSACCENAEMLGLDGLGPAMSSCATKSCLLHTLALHGSSFSQGALSRPRMRAVSGTEIGKLWPLMRRI